MPQGRKKGPVQNEFKDLKEIVVARLNRRVGNRSNPFYDLINPQDKL